MSKASLGLLIGGLLLMVAAPIAWAQDVGLRTLFTTEQERRVINANRNRQESKPAAPVSTPVEEIAPEPVSEPVREEVKTQYRVSGVATDLAGSQTVWINGRSYLSGDQMEDGARIAIQGTRVIITTPDGKRHQGQSGEVLEVTYLRTIEN